MGGCLFMKSKKVVIIVAISAVAVSIIAFFAIPVTVTLDYGYARASDIGNDSYWSKPIGGEPVEKYRLTPVRVRRFSSYSPPLLGNRYSGFEVEYEFAGWYKDSALTVPWVNGQDKVSSSITLYAKWG